MQLTTAQELPREAASTGKLFDARRKEKGEVGDEAGRLEAEGKGIQGSDQEEDFDVIN